MRPGGGMTDAPIPPAAWLLYEQRKAAFQAAHPGATPEEHEAFMRRVLDELGL